MLNIEYRRKMREGRLAIRANDRQEEFGYKEDLLCFIASYCTTEVRCHQSYSEGSRSQLLTEAGKELKHGRN